MTRVERWSVVRLRLKRSISVTNLSYIRALVRRYQGAIKALLKRY
jgi:hypothetical protein